MSFLSRYGIVLAGLLAFLPDTNPAQAGATLPRAPTASAGLERSGAPASGEIPSAAPRSGALSDRGLSKFGSFYDQLIIAWWRWAAGTPASVNPLLKAESTNCDAGIQPRNVRFLGGTFTGGAGDPVVRRCTVPRGTALFFPILNGSWLSSPAPFPDCKDYFAPDAWYGSRPGDPAYKQFIGEIYIPAGKDPGNQSGSLTLSIDGKPIGGLERLYTRSSVFFNVKIPDYNIYDAVVAMLSGNSEANCFDRMFLTPSVGFGYHVFVPPLPPGQHTLRWTAQGKLPFFANTLYQDVTYHLTVKR